MAPFFFCLKRREEKQYTDEEDYKQDHDVDVHMAQALTHPFLIQLSILYSEGDVRLPRSPLTPFTNLDDDTFNLHVIQPTSHPSIHPIVYLGILCLLLFV